MASFEHEILVDLFRKRPDTARELLRICFGIELPDGIAEAGPADLSQVVSTEYRADHVVVLRDGAGHAVSAVIVEVQRSQDLDKRYSWPVYVATLRANLRCPVLLLVLAPEEAVARWARYEIETGHPGFDLEPIVVSFETVPRMIDHDLARRVPELAVLSAIAHDDADVGVAALAAISGLPEDLTRLYFDLIVRAHPEIALLEATMEGYEYKSEYVKGLVSQGREEGREEVAIALAKAKLVSFSDEHARRIRQVHGPALMNLIIALGGARDDADVQQILARLDPVES